MTIAAFHGFPLWIHVLLMKNEIEMLLHDLPESNTFELFVLYWEDLPVYQAAAAEASLEKGRHLFTCNHAEDNAHTSIKSYATERGYKHECPLQVVRYDHR